LHRVLVPLVGGDMASSRPPPPKDMLCRTVGSVIVIVQNAQPPSDKEWNDFLKLLVERRTDLPKLKLLVMTAGGGPSSAQRKRLQAALGGTSLRVAVVSDSMKVRFVGSTIALFHKDYRSFLTSEMDQASEHLNLSPGERRHAESEIKELTTFLK
jgi:hypothetical protein